MQSRLFVLQFFYDAHQLFMRFIRRGDVLFIVEVDKCLSFHDEFCDTQVDGLVMLDVAVRFDNFHLAQIAWTVADR